MIIVSLVSGFVISRIAKKYAVFVKSELVVGDSDEVSCSLEVEEFIPIIQLC